MAKKLIFLLMLFLLYGNADVRYKIISISTENIKIGSEMKRKGDTFSSSEKIYWVDDTQVMRVVDTETEESFVISAKVEEFARGHTTSTYENIEVLLMTDLIQNASDVVHGGYHFFTYEQGDGKTGKVRIEKNMFLDEYPQKLQLFYYNPVTSKTELKTDDFRSLIDELIITDHMVKRQMSGLDYYQGELGEMTSDYMLLMNSYIDEKYEGLILTYDDIKMFITLKY